MSGEGASSRYEILIAGEGGQGLILAGLILAEAAALFDGKNVAHTQAYGPEARGGASQSEVIISNGQIDYPKVLMADLFLAMSQKACDKYCYSTRESGIIVVDSDKVGRVCTSSAYKVPITERTRQVTGRILAANILALGVVVGLSKVVSVEGIEKAVTNRVPSGTEEMNLQALHAGLEEAEKVLRRRQEEDCADWLEDQWEGTIPLRLG